jgi:hypothetical protein
MVKRFREGIGALNHILDAIEREPQRARIRAYPNYQDMATEEERLGFHRVVAAAEDAGAVVVKRDRRAGPEDIRFVELVNRSTLALFLRRTPAEDAAAWAIAKLREAVGATSAWLNDVIGEIAAGWGTLREPYPGLEPGDVKTATKFLQILLAIERGEHLKGKDMRTFSQRACGDSKAVERGMARLARALRQRNELPEVRPREVLAACGIEKFPQPVLLRGRLRLANGTDIDARPYVGVPPEWASVLTPVGPVPYVLIIENLASFNRQSREIDDDGILVFSGGFPSRAVLAAIRRLDEVLPTLVPFFHWGDTDRHGRLIFEHLAGALGRGLRPHLMENADPGSFEQEEMDPVSPLDRPMASLSVGGGQ